MKLEDIITHLSNTLIIAKECHVDDYNVAFVKNPNESFMLCTFDHQNKTVSINTAGFEAGMGISCFDKKEKMS